MKISAHILFLLMSVLFSMAYSAATNMLAVDEVIISPFPAILACVFALLVLYGLFFLLSVLRKRGFHNPSKMTGRRVPVFVWAFCMLLTVYTLCYLAYFPGPAVNDSLMIFRNGMMMANASPILYCVFITVFSKLGQWSGSAQLGLVLCNFFQMLLVCTMSAWVIAWVYEKRLPRVIKLLVLLYYLLNPMLIIYSFTMIKDTLFSLGVAVLFVLSYDLVMENRACAMHWVVLALDILLLISFRNGVIYMALVYLVLLIFTVKNKKTVRNAVLIVLSCVLCAGGLSAALEKRFDIEYASKEMLAIPIQQLAAVVAYDGELTDSQEKVISGMMPLEDIKLRYTPYNVDAIKWDLFFNDHYVNENLPEILKVWLEVYPSNVDIYTKAYLWETFWFWAPVQQGEVKIFETVVDLDPEWHVATGVMDAPILNGVLGQLLRNFCGSGRHFLREGVLFWIMLFSLLEAYALSGDKRVFAVYSVCLFQWIVLMVSTPVFHSIRYVLSYVYALPLFFAILFLVKNSGENCTDAYLSEEISVAV